MNQDYEQTELSKSVLAGLFAGITATTLSLIFNVCFRRINGFSLSAIINVSTIIFSLILVVTISGVIFYFFHHYFKNGMLIFKLGSIVFTLLLIAGAMHIQRSSDPSISKGFRELLLGIISITEVCTIFIIPFLFKHDYI